MSTNQNYRYPLEKAMILLFPIITISIIAIGAILFSMGPDFLKPILDSMHF